MTDPHHHRPLPHSPTSRWSGRLVRYALTALFIGAACVRLFQQDLSTPRAAMKELENQSPDSRKLEQQKRREEERSSSPSGGPKLRVNNNPHNYTIVHHTSMPNKEETDAAPISTTTKTETTNDAKQQKLMEQTEKDMIKEEESDNEDDDEKEEEQTAPVEDDKDEDEDDEKEDSAPAEEDEEEDEDETDEEEEDNSPAENDKKEMGQEEDDEEEDNTPAEKDADEENEEEQEKAADDEDNAAEKATDEEQEDNADEEDNAAEKATDEAENDTEQEQDDEEDNAKATDEAEDETGDEETEQEEEQDEASPAGAQATEDDDGDDDDDDDSEEQEAEASDKEEGEEEQADEDTVEKEEETAPEDTDEEEENKTEGDEDNTVAETDGDEDNTDEDETDEEVEQQANDKEEEDEKEPQVTAAPVKSTTSATASTSAPTNTSNTTTSTKPQFDVNFNTTKGIGACLLIKDDNHWVIEWLAYHWFVMPLRHLVVVVDPYSETSPMGIFDRWKGLMEIETWKDEDFVPPIPDETREKYKNNTQLMQHRHRQASFYQECLSHMKTKVEMPFVFLTDSDEFISINYRGLQQGMKHTRPNSTSEDLPIPNLKLAGNLSREFPIQTPGSVLQFLAKHRTISNKVQKCLYILRYVVGSKESEETQVERYLSNGTLSTTASSTTRTLGSFGFATTSTETTNISAHDFLTQRFLYQTPTYSNLGKNMMHVTAVSLLKANANVHKVSRHCPPNTWAAALEQSHFLKIHHYIGSADQYLSRADPRAVPKKKGMKFKAGQGTANYVERNLQSYLKLGTDATLFDNSAQGWIEGFVNQVGIAKAQQLLAGVGQVGAE